MGVFLRGLAMGAADVVPGVSGGTIALITGIYERLLTAIVSADAEALSLLIRGRWQTLWFRVDGSFLTVLMAGILSAIFSLASAIHWLLSHYPQPLWSFFGGLILVSGAFLVRDEVNLLRINRFIVFALGVSLAVSIALLAPASFIPGLPGYFFAGAIAICAMILPGISGSFILVLLGMYGAVLDAVRTLQLAELSVFAAGCALGLLTFSRVLQIALARARPAAMAFLGGVLMGSLLAVWPWKTAVLTATETGVIELMRPVLPSHSSVADSQLMLCAAAGVLGCLLVWALRHLAGKGRY